LAEGAIVGCSPVGINVLEQFRRESHRHHGFSL
jgi:hypothetical protein